MSDWKTLAGRFPSVEDRLAALHRICAGDDPELDLLCVEFVDEVVASGDVMRAFDRAARERRPVLPAAPDTRGSTAQGPRDLVLKRYELRDAIESVIAAIGRRSHVTPALALWLFETAKLWSAERRKSLHAIDEANVTPEVLARGIESLVGYAAANPDPGGEILRDVAMAWVGKPGWFVELVSRIAADDRASDALADGLYNAEVEAGDPIDDEARARLLVHALDAPSGARALALAALARYRDTDGIFDVVVAALRDPSAHCRVVEGAARLAIARRLFAQPVLEAAAGCREEGRAGERARPDLAEAVAALVKACRVALSPAPTASPGERASVVEGVFYVSGCVAIDNVAVAAVRRPLALAPASDWRTDEDEVAVAVVGASTASYHVAPVRFAMQQTGASGARRNVIIAGTLDGRVVVLVHSPFSRGSWGADNFALGFRPSDRSWVAYRAEAGGLAVASDLVAVVGESDLTSVAFGEAIAWNDANGLRIVADTTPYHLDDWECSVEVAAGMAAREARQSERSATSVPAARITAGCPTWRGGEPRDGCAWSGGVAIVLDRELDGDRSALLWIDRP